MQHVVQFHTPARFSVEDMDHVMTGCFVKVMDGRETYWVQVNAISGDKIGGQVFEIANRADRPVIAQGTTIFFKREHIVELGCDYLCFC